MPGNGDVRNVPAPFVCSWTLDDSGVGWVRLAGELDLAAAPELEATLQDAGARAQVVVLDLQQLAFIDSAGVHAILCASERAQEAGRRLIVAHAQRQVARLLSLAVRAGTLEIDDWTGETSAHLQTIGTSVA